MAIFAHGADGRDFKAIRRPWPTLAPDPSTGSSKGDSLGPRPWDFVQFRRPGLQGIRSQGPVLEDQASMIDDSPAPKGPGRGIHRESGIPPSLAFMIRFERRFDAAGKKGSLRRSIRCRQDRQWIPRGRSREEFQNLLFFILRIFQGQGIARYARQDASVRQCIVKAVA